MKSQSYNFKLTGDAQLGLNVVLVGFRNDSVDPVAGIDVFNSILEMITNLEVCTACSKKHFRPCAVPVEKRNIFQ